MAHAHTFVSLSYLRDQILEYLYRYFAVQQPNFAHLWNTLADTKKHRLAYLNTLQNRCMASGTELTMVPAELGAFEMYVTELAYIRQICEQYTMSFTLPTLFKMTLMFERESHTQNGYHLANVNSPDVFQVITTINNEIETDIPRIESAAAEIAISPIFNPITITELRIYVQKSAEQNRVAETDTFNLNPSQEGDVAQAQKEEIKQASHLDDLPEGQKTPVRDFMMAPGASSANPNLVTEEGVKTPEAPKSMETISAEELAKLKIENSRLREDNQRLQIELDKLIAVFETLKASS